MVDVSLWLGLGVIVAVCDCDAVGDRLGVRVKLGDCVVLSVAVALALWVNDGVADVLAVVL